MAAESKPSTSRRPATRTVPVIALVSPELMPRSEKNIASVTMNDGSPVSITSQPLISPMQAAKANVTRIAGHMDMPYSVVSTPHSSPEVPTMTPELRSNSPAIISSATGTATMPTVEATSVQRAVPVMVAKIPVVSTPANMA